MVEGDEFEDIVGFECLDFDVDFVVFEIDV